MNTTTTAARVLVGFALAAAAACGDDTRPASTINPTTSSPATSSPATTSSPPRLDLETLHLDAPDGVTDQQASGWQTTFAGGAPLVWRTATADSARATMQALLDLTALQCGMLDIDPDIAAPAVEAQLTDLAERLPGQVPWMTPSGGRDSVQAAGEATAEHICPRHADIYPDF